MYHAITRHPLITLGLIAFINIVIAFAYVSQPTGSYLTTPLQVNSDLHSYLSTITYVRSSLSGESDTVPAPAPQVVLTRALTTPLMTLSAMVIGGITGNDAFGIIAINIIFYFLLVPIFYRIGVLIFDNQKTAFIATVILFTNWVLFTYGTAFLVDMGGWFFFLLTTMCALEYYRDPTRRSYFYYGILSSIVGVFFKEYGALGMATLGILVAASHTPAMQKIKDIATAFLLFGTALVAYHLWFYLHFDYTYLSWYGHNYESYAAPESGSYKHDFSHLIRVLVLIFLPGWPIFLLGGVRIVKELRGRVASLLIPLGAMLPASLAFLAWPSFAHRIAFTLIPWVALVAAFGLARIQKRWLILGVLIGYALVNYHVGLLTAGLTFPW